MYLINAPTHIFLPRKTIKDKKIPINLNWYRNAKCFESNDAKKAYKEFVRPQIEQLPKFERLGLEMKIFPPTARLTDIGNIGSITEKFFLDAMVELGKLEDDNYLFVPTSLVEFGKVDKTNPRVEIRIKGLSC